MSLQPEVSEEELAMKIEIFRDIAIFTLLISASTTGMGQVEMTGNSESANFEALEAVDNAILDDMRGGFVTGDGVRLDVGVQKASYVDGMLQVQNSFRAEDVALLENGFGGNITAGDLQNVTSAFSTLIQNNLDQKTIQNFTVIDVNVRNFGNLQTGFVEAIRGLQDVHTIR
jgi:hypothetical protein